MGAGVDISIDNSMNISMNIVVGGSRPLEAASSVSIGPSLVMLTKLSHSPSWAVHLVCAAPRTRCCACNKWCGVRIAG